MGGWALSLALWDTSQQGQGEETSPLTGGLQGGIGEVAKTPPL